MPFKILTEMLHKSRLNTAFTHVVIKKLGIHVGAQQRTHYFKENRGTLCTLHYLQT